MSDNMKNVGTPDRNLIALGEEHEVRYWTNKLGVSREELRAAVSTVGNSAAKVREHLGRKSN